MVYLGGSLALAALELLVHIAYERALEEHVAIPVDFDESLPLRVEADRPPDGWGGAEGLAYTQALGDAWARRGASALLAVPSRVVPIERSYLLNPEHPDAERVAIGEPWPFRCDPRLLKRWRRKREGPPGPPRASSVPAPPATAPTRPSACAWTRWRWRVRRVGWRSTLEME